MGLGLLEKSKLKEWKKEMKKVGLKRSEGQKILEFLSRTLLKISQKDIWNPRCKMVTEWEKVQGINTKEKRREKNIYINSIAGNK